LHGNPSGGGRASNNLVFREKTASASESLANNLAANGADIEVAVHGGYIWASRGAPSRPKRPRLAAFRRQTAGARCRLVNHS